MTPFVDLAWLAANLSAAQVIILDATLPPVGIFPKVDTRASYLAQHIPGAIFFDIDALSDPTSGLPHTLPSPESFAAAMSELGIDDRSTLVIYEQQGVFSAPRARWMLRTLGAREVLLLNGDLQQWLAAGLPVESGEAHRAPAIFHASLQPDAVKHFPEMQQAIQQAIATHTQILDARSTGRFTGTAPEPRPGLSSGHMPGSTSIPFTELSTDGRLKPAADLRALFAQKQVDLAAPIITTCGSGVTAAVVSLALEVAGATNVSLYDGSWAEYASHPEAVIEAVPQSR